MCFLSLIHIYRGWLGTFTLVLVIAVPFFSLALSLPGLLCCALKLSPETPTVFRGQEGALSLIHI